MSDLPSATQPELSAALAALTAELDDRFDWCGKADDIHPILSHLTIGHLRAIAAALAAPYVPGMVEVDKVGYAQIIDETAGAHLFTWDARRQTGTHRYFAAVTS